MKAVVVPVTPFVQNCTVLWCEETMKGAAVDPGGEVGKILHAVEQHGVTLENILITHGHLDHAGGAADLSEQAGLPIEGPHKEDKFLIDTLEDQAQQFGAGPTRIFVPDRWLDEGDTVGFGNVEMDVIHCPGHTPGHVVFFHKASNLAMVGDVLFQGSIGRTDFPRGDFDTLISSIRNKLWPLGDDVTFVSGHGPTSTFGAERKSNAFVADHVLGAAG